MALGDDDRSSGIQEAPDGMQALDVLRAVAAEPQPTMMHYFVLVTSTDMTATDMAGDGEITTLLRDL